MTHRQTLNLAYAAFWAALALTLAIAGLALSNGMNITPAMQAMALLALPAYLLGVPALVVRHTRLFAQETPPQRPQELTATTQAEARAEAMAAREKYKEHPHNTHHDWLRAATEELGECSKVIHNGGMTQQEMDDLRHEILQLAGTAMNWADCADFSPTKPGQRA